MERLAREQRGEVLEQRLVLRRFGRLTVDRGDLRQREIALAGFRRTDATGQVVAGAQVEAADLARRDVGVVGTSEVRSIGRTQEAETIGQDFQHALRGDALAVTREHLEQGEDHFLLAHARHAFGDAQLVGDIQQLECRHALEVGQVVDREAWRQGGQWLVVDGFAAFIATVVVAARLVLSRLAVLARLVFTRATLVGFATLLAITTVAETIAARIMACLAVVWLRRLSRWR